MNPSNIQRFDELTGQILGRLYESFPLPSPMLAAAFIGPDNAPMPGCPFGCKFPQADFFEATMLWLLASGYLSATQDNPSCNFRRCVLTPKGLEVLRLVPESLQAPLGAQLADAARSQAAPMLSALVVQVLSAGAQFLAR